MNAQLAVVLNQLTAVAGIAKARLAAFQATRIALEAKITPSGLAGPGLSDYPIIKLLEAEINAETNILNVIGSAGPPDPKSGLPTGDGLILTYMTWDVNDNNRSALGLPPVDPTPIPDAIVQYAATVINSVFGVSGFTFAVLPKGSLPGATSMNPNAPAGGNSPWGVI